MRVAKLHARSKLDFGEATTHELRQHDGREVPS
jgi:hypothetical protein